MQAARFEHLLFDPFSLLQNGFVTAEVDAGGCDVVQALVVALVVVVVDEGFDLSIEVAGQEVVLQQYPVLESLMPTLNFALCLGVIRCATRVLHAFVEVGVGYCYTIGQGGGAVMSLLQQTMLPCLIGQDAENIERICRDLLYRTHASAVGAVTIVRDDLRRLGALGSALQVRRLAAALAEWRGLCSE